MDLLISFILLTLVSVALFWLAFRITRTWRRPAVAVLGVGALAALLGFTVLLLDKPVMIRLIPYSGVVILGNWMMPLAAVLIAAVWRAMQTPAARRVLPCAGLALMAVLVTLRPVISPRPATKNMWFGKLCLQTSDATCSPAAAATILAIHNIRADEHEMTRLCLTMANGTTLHGLYRGLVLKTRGTPYQVQLIEGDVPTLHAMSTPVLLNAGLEKGQEVDPIYTEKWGWLPGVEHTVVLRRFYKDGRILMYDPSVGIEFWEKESLQILWHGVGFRLDGPDPDGVLVAR